jgi:hypothetical protein
MAVILLTVAVLVAAGAIGIFETHRDEIDRLEHPVSK